MRQIKVKCTFVIPIEVPDDSEDYNVCFDIEERNCPGTGLVGRALEDHMERCDKQSICWACALSGKCEIVEESLCDSEGVT